MSEVIRDEHGRFLPGHAPKSPGRPKREVEQAYYDVTVGAVPTSEWRKVIDAMIKQAKRGNVAAATWLGNYLLGKPQDHLDITSAGEALKAFIGFTPDEWQEQADGDEKPNT